MLAYMGELKTELSLIEVIDTRKKTECIPFESDDEISRNQFHDDLSQKENRKLICKYS